MWKKIMAFCMILIVALGFAGCGKQSVQEQQTQGQGQQAAQEVKKSSIKVEVATSNNVDQDASITEAISKIKTKVTNPKLIIVYMKPSYNYENVVKKIGEVFPSSKIFGTTTNNELMSNEGIVEGIGMLAIESSEKLNIGVSAQDYAGKFDESNVSVVVKKALEEAANNAGVSATEKPKFVYISSVYGTEESAIKAIEGAFGKDVPVYGGTPADNGYGKDTPKPGAWGVIGNDKAYQNGISLVSFYDGMKIGGDFKAGFFGETKEKSGIVTSIKNPRVLTAIDGKPAGDVFTSWIGTKQTTDGYADMFARIFDVNGQKEMVTISPAPNGIDPETKAITLYSNVQKGDKLYYIKANKAAMLSRVNPMVTQAIINAELKKSDVSGGLLCLCTGARQVIGSDLNQLVSNVNKSIDNKPWLGVVSYGEQGQIKGYGSFQGNFMNSLVVFGD